MGIADAIKMAVGKHNALTDRIDTLRDQIDEAATDRLLQTKVLAEIVKGAPASDLDDVREAFSGMTDGEAAGTLRAIISARKRKDE